MKLKTFVLVNDNKVVSPLLVTTRQYGDWMEDTFDHSICRMELYLSCIKADGSRVVERHPGTRIGQFFKDTRVSKTNLMSWYLPAHKEVAGRLIKYNLVDANDVRNGCRAYTAEQIQFYINSNIDKTMNVLSCCAEPIQIRISDDDLACTVKPEIKTRNKKLF